VSGLVGGDPQTTGIPDETRTERRREILATLAIVSVFAALAIGRPIARRLARHPTRERCAEMIDRYSEQESRARERAPSSVHVSIDAMDVSRCVADLTDAEVECALGASYVDALERCLP
jgi:hypothetical protein